MFIIAGTTLINMDQVAVSMPEEDRIVFYYNEGTTTVIFNPENVMTEYVKIVTGLQSRNNIVELENVVEVDPNEDDIASAIE